MAILGFHLGNLDPVIAGAQKYPLTMEECFNMIVGDRNRHYLSEGEDGLIIQKFSEIKIAEHMLTENIRTNTQTFVAREINKRISLPISLWLAKFRVTPNTITAVNICIGLCAGIGAAGRTYTGVLLGAILFQTASVIDGCDGEVAKLTFRTSKFGQYIDSVSDNLSLAAFLTGMMIHQYRIGHSYAAFIFGGLLITGALAILALMSDYLKRNSDSASFVTFDKEFLQKLTPENTPALAYHLIKYFKIFFKKDFFSLTFLIFAIFGILHWWFYIITIGVWVGTFVLMSLRKMWVGGKAGTL
jgi:phosphatidylglycerophosphate synthase